MISAKIERLRRIAGASKIFLQNLLQFIIFITRCSSSSFFELLFHGVCSTVFSKFMTMWINFRMVYSTRCVLDTTLVAISDMK